MSYKDFDPFSYMDLKPQNYKFKQNMSTDLDLIIKTLENISNDWKEREESLQYIGRIVKGNQGKSDFFIKSFNNKLSSSLEIQLSDLRSTVMKEACRITSLCAKELGLLIEQGITQLLTQNCLFKIAGSANQVISESASKCILNILRYVHSIKVMSSICEVKSMKANNVRILCAQSLVNIMSFYDESLINKLKNILENTMNVLLSDPNAEVRATTRQSFILYKSRFNEDAIKIFEKLGKNVQKQILEDEKNFGNININIKKEKNNNYIKKINELVDENLKVINYNEILKNKPKTPEYNQFKIKAFNEFPKQTKKDNLKSFKKTERSTSKNRKNITGIDNENEKLPKEETVKYINVDDDDIIENEDEIEEEKKDEEDFQEINMVLNYTNKNKQNKNNKISFNKKSQNKNNDLSLNNTKNTNNNNIRISMKQNDNTKDNEPNKISQSQKINSISEYKNKDPNDIIDELIINSDNPEKKINTKINENTNSLKISKIDSKIKTDRTKKLNNKNNLSITGKNLKNKIKQKNKDISKDKNKSDTNKNHEIKNKIIKSKFEELKSVKNLTITTNYTNRLNNEKENKNKGKSREKIKILKDEFNINNNNQRITLNKTKNNNMTKNYGTIDNNILIIKDDNISDEDFEDKENNFSTSKIDKENIEYININLEKGENNVEDMIDEAIKKDKNRDKTKIYNIKTVEKMKNNNKIDNNKNDTNIIKKSKNTKFENKIENFQDLYNELSNINTKTNNKNDEEILNNENLEQKVIFILDKLDNLIIQNEKLILFQYLFNHFNMILTEIKTFSQSTIRRYIDIHIENLKQNDSNLVEQVIKNLMRMIFYLKDIFTTYDIQLILKILLFSIDEFNIKTLKNLSNDLLEIIKKKYDNEELFQNVYSLLGEYNTNYDECYDFMYLLIPSCDKILKNINYFKQVFRLICLTDINSKKVGKIIDILYRNYRNNFNQAFEEESQENKEKILMFMEKLNSLYFREFKSIHENNNSIIKNSYNNNQTQSQIKSSIKNRNKTNSSKTEQTESDNFSSFNKENFSHKNSESNKSYTNYSNNLKTDNTKVDNIIIDRPSKNNNNINTIKTNLNGNNIISINNSNNNNIIITNKLPDDIIPNEIKLAIKDNNLDQYMLYIQKHKSYVPEFLLLLSNKNYSQPKYILTLLNFTQNILNNPDFSIDLNTCINLIIKQMIYILNTNKKDQKIEELIKNILSDLPKYLISEKCLSSIAKYLTSETDTQILEILILSIENFAKSYKKKKDNINKEIIPLQNLLEYFISEIFNLLKHQNSEIRKRALYCCLEVYSVTGKEFEPFLAKIPNAQQNLIRLYIKKRLG